MKILMLTEDFFPSIDGGALVRTRFSEVVVEKGHDITVVTPRDEGEDYYDNREGVSIVRPYKSKPSDKQGYEMISIVYRAISSIQLILYLLIWTRDKEFDIIYSKSYSTHLVAKILGKIYRIKVVNFIGGTPSYGEDIERYKIILEQLAMRFLMGDFVFTRSERIREMVKYKAKTPADVLHGVVNKKKITDISASSNNERKGDTISLAFVGRLNPLKQPKKAIDILSKLPKNYTLTVVGDGPSRKELERYALEQGVNKRTEFRGELSHEDCLETILNSDSLIITSKIEAYPSVVFEGLALNCDVFAPPLGVLEELEENHLHKLNIEDFPRAIEDISSAKSARVNKDILDRYSIERYTEQSLNKFEELL